MLLLGVVFHIVPSMVEQPGEMGFPQAAGYSRLSKAVEGSSTSWHCLLIACLVPKCRDGSTMNRIDSVKR